MGGIGGAGAIFGKSVSCLSNLGKAIKMTAKITGGISSVMGGFDTLAMGLGMLDPNNPLTALNSKLHQSTLYNAFQTGVGVVATFTGAASSTMACFVAGTMVLTTNGLIAIEKLRAGDKVISTNPDTLETSEKTVLETYIRKVDNLVHLTINGEEIVTTDNHPFYVQGRGFIEAGSLLVGDKLVSVNGEDLFVEEHSVELTEKPVSVYNFNVDDAHTYFVGENAVWVHNVKCTREDINNLKNTENFDESAITEIFDGDINRRGDAKGLHYEGLEDARGSTVPNTKTAPNSQGVYSADVIVDGVSKAANGGKSTFFPDNMTPQDVIDSINEVYNNKGQPIATGNVNSLYSFRSDKWWLEDKNVG